MVNSNFDNPGVILKSKMRATTFILGVWGRVVEKVIEKLDFFAKTRVSGWVKNSNNWL
jgi:hypothetical protein